MVLKSSRKKCVAHHGKLVKPIAGFALNQSPIPTSNASPHRSTSNGMRQLWGIRSQAHGVREETRVEARQGEPTATSPHPAARKTQEARARPPAHSLAGRKQGMRGRSSPLRGEGRECTRLFARTVRIRPHKRPREGQDHCSQRRRPHTAHPWGRWYASDRK